MTEDQVPDDGGRVVLDEAPGELDLGYQVSLDSFSGPLDLLLHLVRRAEVDIADIPIAQIADQFIATVSRWEDMDLDVAGDFILMAASLLELKARLVVPPDEGEQTEDEEEEPIDPRADLIRQLLAFRRVKEAVQEVERLETQRLLEHERRFHEEVPEDPEEADGIDLANADAWQLFKAWEGVLQAIAGTRPRTVVYDDIPIEERIRQLDRIMREAREAQLAWLMEQAERPIQRCGVLVAVLESIRQRMVEATQHEQYGPVYLRYQDEEERRHERAAPPSADADEPQRRRRRRLPLVTFHRAVASDEAEIEQEGDEVEEEEFRVESDEERFLRELDEQTGIDDLLARVGDWEGVLQQELVERGIVVATEPTGEDVEAGAAVDGAAGTAGVDAHRG